MQLATPIVLLALASCLYACGGSDSGGDKATIASTIEIALSRTDPGDCTELMTQAFVEQTMADEGAEAVEECEQSAEVEESANPPVEVSDIEVDRSHATANVTYAEGAFAFAGQMITVALVEEDGAWKLDENIRFAKLDPREVVNALAEGWGSPAEDDCIRRALGEWSRPELEEFLIDGSEEPFDEIVISCAGKR